LSGCTIVVGVNSLKKVRFGVLRALPNTLQVGWLDSHAPCDDLQNTHVDDDGDEYCFVVHVQPPVGGQSM